MQTAPLSPEMNHTVCPCVHLPPHLCIDVLRILVPNIIVRGGHDVAGGMQAAMHRVHRLRPEERGALQRLESQTAMQMGGDHRGMPVLCSSQFGRMELNTALAA